MGGWEKRWGILFKDIIGGRIEDGDKGEESGRKERERGKVGRERE